MGKINDRWIAYMKGKYAKKEIPWEKSDTWVWSFWTLIFPTLSLIPLLFWLLKKFLIDYMLAKKGFETTIIYISIIIVLRPLIFDLVSKILTFKEEVRKS
jgi:hypothetical protein